MAAQYCVMNTDAITTPAAMITTTVFVIMALAIVTVAIVTTTSYSTGIIASLFSNNQYFSLKGGEKHGINQHYLWLFSIVRGLYM